MTDKEKLTELADTGECLIMLGEAIRNHAKRGNMADAKTALTAAEIAAPELIRETKEKVV